MINRGQITQDSEYHQLKILFASHILKKGFNMIWKSYILAPFEGKHSENLHALRAQIKLIHTLAEFTKSV